MFTNDQSHDSLNLQFDQTVLLPVNKPMACIFQLPSLLLAQAANTWISRKHILNIWVSLGLTKRGKQTWDEFNAPILGHMENKTNKLCDYISAMI